MVALLVALVIVIALAIELYVARRGTPTVPAASRSLRPMNLPQPPGSVFVTPNHTWVQLTTEGSVRVGIDDLLAQALGDVESLWVPQPGSDIRKGEPLMKLRVRGRELVVTSPGDGTVESFNDRAASAPWLIIHDPYRSGWVVSLTPHDYEATISPLRMGSSATAWLRNEMTRLVEFISSRTEIAGAPVLADGAMPTRGAAADLDDSAWNAFQSSFTRSAS